MTGTRSRSYFGWVKQAQAPSNRDLEDLGLLSNIYEIHMTQLALLKEDNPSAYHRLKAKLLRQVR